MEKAVPSDDSLCDYPDCVEPFDDANGKRIAAIRANKIVAFCHEHALRLREKNAPLRTLKEVQSEWLRMGGSSARLPADVFRALQEKIFIAGLR